MREAEAAVRRGEYNKQSKEQKPRTFSSNNGRTEVTIDENNQFSVDVYNSTVRERQEYIPRYRTSDYEQFN